MSQSLPPATYAAAAAAAAAAVVVGVFAVMVVVVVVGEEEEEEEEVVVVAAVVVEAATRSSSIDGVTDPSLTRTACSACTLAGACQSTVRGCQCASAMASRRLARDAEGYQ